MDGSPGEREGLRRFFVTIMASDRDRLRQVTTLGLDLFAARSDESGHRIDGLVKLEDVAKLVEAGYRVLVSDTDRPKRTHESIGFDEWRASMIADLEEQRKQV